MLPKEFLLGNAEMLKTRTLLSSLRRYFFTVGEYPLSIFAVLAEAEIVEGCKVEIIITTAKQQPTKWVLILIFSNQVTGKITITASKFLLC